jgi:hypothetical protein
METQVLQGLQVLRRIAAYLGKEVPIETTMGPISKIVEELNVVTTRLASLVAEQGEADRNFRDLSGKAREQRNALVKEYARPVARQAKLLFPLNTELRRSLTLPSRAMGYEAIIAYVTGFANRVEEHKAQFVAAGFAADFVERLRGQVAVLEKTLAAKQEQYVRRATATSSGVIEFTRARDIVRTLDSMVSPMLAGSGRLAGWKTVSRFVRDGSTEIPLEGAVPSSPAPAGSAAVVADTTSPISHAV